MEIKSLDELVTLLESTEQRLATIENSIEKLEKAQTPEAEELEEEVSEEAEAETPEKEDDPDLNELEKILFR